MLAGRWRCCCPMLRPSGAIPTRRYVMSEILERAARAMIEHPPVAAPPTHELARRLATRRRRRAGTLAAVMLVAATVGLVAISRRDTGKASSNTSAEGRMQCDDYGCHGFDRLPVLDG